MAVLDESLRLRLESLNRRPVPHGPSAASPAKARAVEVSPARAATKADSLASRRAGIAYRKHVAETGLGSPSPRTGRDLVAGLLRLGEVVSMPAGDHLRICLPLEDLWPGGGGRLVSARLAHLRRLLEPPGDDAGAPVPLAADFAHMVAAMPDRMLLLDLETCGLGGSALFLIGLLRQVADVPTVELLVARNYGEEQAILESLWQIVADHHVLVTFNGKSFDWPMVIDRSVRYRFQPEAGPLRHVDLLHHARRRWRERLPNCRLQTLEWHVCRRQRFGDIPGHRIPAAYAEFVRTGFEREMDAILYHNALDLVTLLDLALRLAG